MKLDVKLPPPLARSCTVGSERFPYIIGGETSYSFTKYNQMLRFNPTATEIKEIPINNFPKKLEQQKCVLVEKLNRIYILGRTANGYKYENRIMYSEI